MGLFTKNSPSTTVAEPVRPSGGGVFAKDGAASASSVSAPQPPIVDPPAPPKNNWNPPAPVRAPSTPTSAGGSQFEQLKMRIHQQLVERLDVQNLRSLPPETVRAEVRIVIRELCQSEKGLLSSGDQERLMDEVIDETFGLGPLETLLKDSTISDILVNRSDRIYVERRGKLEQVETRFRDNQHLRQIIDRIVAMVGRRIDETSPMVDARLGDGSRVNAIIPPLALEGPAMSIRRFGSKPLQFEDLVR